MITKATKYPRETCVRGLFRKRLVSEWKRPTPCPGYPGVEFGGVGCTYIFPWDATWADIGNHFDKYHPV